MIVRLFIFLTSLSAFLKGKLWKEWYQRLAATYTNDDWRFMNYGYTPLKPQEKPVLRKEDEKNRLFIQLYAYTLSGIDVLGKDLLEVGSGRGGGCDYVARYLKPASLIGVDFSKNAVALANGFNELPNLHFMEGNAEKLPFENNRFDVVFNVESSHCYGSMPKFVGEVRRVLKPLGLFAWSDFRKKDDMKTEELLFLSSGFEIVSKEDITDCIIQALEMNSHEKEKAIQKKVPAYFQKIFSEFAGVEKSQIFNAFKDGTLTYWHYRLKNLKD